jgi:hypothetical protein
MRKFSNINGYSGRYFTNTAFLGKGPDRMSDVVYTVIVDDHPRLHSFLLTWNSEKGWLNEDFTEADAPFINALQQAIDEDAEQSRH